MKFFFSKTDSLYKIFKALEKIPSHRHVEIFVDPEHALFDNEWWGYQIKEILDKKSIEAVFIAKNKKNRNYYKGVGLNVNLQKEKKVEKTLNILYLFFFNIKKFHLHTYESRKYVFAIIFMIEILFIVGIFWFIISLVMPSVSISVQGSEESETIIYNVRYYPNDEKISSIENRFLNIPFYTGSMNYKYDLITSVANVKFVINPSYGKIKIYNKKDVEYELMKNTQFITSDGLIFRSIDDFIIPAGSEKRPSEIIISVQAGEYDEYDNIIGIRGNIPLKTQMLIKRLDESYYSKDIWAESIENFVGGNVETEGTVTESDVELLKKKLVDYIYSQKMFIVSQNFPIEEGFVLPFETITTTVFNNIEVEQQEEDNTPTIKGTVNVTYNYIYVLRSDLFQIFMTYIKERQSENMALVRIDKDSIHFLKSSDATSADEIKKDGKIYIISTQVGVIQSYDFEKDPRGILSEIKDNIVGMNVDEARNYILSTFDEIGSVDISLPLRYDSIPMVKSRIKIGFK